MVRWKYLKHMIWKPCIYNVFVGSQEAELKWLPLFQKRFLRVNKAHTEDVKAVVRNYYSCATLFICLLIYFISYIFSWSFNPCHPSEKYTFTLTSSSSLPLPVGSVGLNGNGFYTFIPLRDGFWGGWEFPLPDEEEGKAATLCSDSRPVAANSCGRKNWGGHCFHLRGWLDPSASEPGVSHSSLHPLRRQCFSFAKGASKAVGISWWPRYQSSISFIFEECSVVSGIYHFDFSSSFFLLQSFSLLCVSAFSFYFSLVSCPFFSLVLLFSCCRNREFVIAVASFQKVDQKVFKTIII